MVNAKTDPLRRSFSEASKPKIFEGETVETRWDLKKIIIGVVILLVLGLLGAIMLTGISRQSPISDRETLGAISEDENESRGGRERPSLPSSQDVERIIHETRETISNITAENLTSSQAAIQKMISDLEVLQGKKDAKDVICDLVCKK
ncbi:MAG: hypothetical protein A2868_01100 [Candidatus Levybacteria bacterium RIFCSPHIGHO2_01_FULL_40_15b]|nr:MAG: hypothetical protein A2868_01100 [Candidatus Levybacteria bacterium RIFCSPHIGHO2_01_FULL_40_15b]